jgi:hypothetical protein
MIVVASRRSCRPPRAALMSLSISTASDTRECGAPHWPAVAACLRAGLCASAREAAEIRPCSLYAATRWNCLAVITALPLTRQVPYAVRHK